MRKFLYIFSGILVIILSGCDMNSTSRTTLSSVAKLSGFYFAANDSFPGLAAATFTIEERIDTGLVWNKDSMLYGTSLDSVIPKFTFEAMPGSAVLKTPDTTLALTGYDTLNFSKMPIYLTIRSSDKSTTKTYEIRATVHQVDPDLYTWEQLTDHIYDPDDSEQRVVELGDYFVMVKSNGYEYFTYSSLDGAYWTDEVEITTLPAGTKVRQIVSDGTTLYYGQGKHIYTSTDAITWTDTPVQDSVVTMLLYWNNLVWASVADGEEAYELATFEGGTLSRTGLKPDGEFPVSDFATVAFQSASWRDRAMIIGGFAENGRSLNTRWNLEYSRHTPENNGYRLREFSIDRPSFTSLTGISVIEYNNQLMLFGGVDDKMNYFGRDILISNNEGLTWELADTTKNQLPDVYQARQKQSALVRDNNIFLFGGQDGHATYSDVYQGRLNSIDW